MEKFAIGLLIGGIAGAVLTANNYKMRTLVKKSQEEVKQKFDEMMDDKLEDLEKVKEKAEEKAEEVKDKIEDKAKDVKNNLSKRFKGKRGEQPTPATE